MCGFPAVCTRRNHKILQITECPFPPEIRVVKEGISLSEAGFQSAVMCPPIMGRPAREIWKGIAVFRPTCLRWNRRIVDKLLYQSVFFSPAWYLAIKEVLAEYQPDVLHVHDIWLGRTVLLARGKERLVFDLHESMPAAVMEYLSGYRGCVKAFNAAFKTYRRVLRYERKMLTRSDKVFVVVREALQRVLEDHPILPAEKIVNVENLESIRFLEAETPSAGGPLVGRQIVLYIGGFGPHRGIDTLIRAMARIKEWGLSVELQLVGAKESSYLEMLRELVDKLGVGSYVKIVGWVPAEAVLSYIRQATICTVPHNASQHTDTTIPHKLYQYMIARKPVLVSTSVPLARTVGAARAGVVFDAGNDKDCAEKIRDILACPGKLSEYGDNGFRYVLEDGHNWEEESAPALVGTYDDLFGEGKVEGILADAD